MKILSTIWVIVLAALLYAALNIAAADDGAYLRLSMGSNIDGKYWIRGEDHSGTVLGRVQAGVSYKGFFIELDHLSSIAKEDAGINRGFIGYEMRW